MQFVVADIKTVYNAFLRRPALTKFMVIPNYAYLVLKMLGPSGVISTKGDVKQAYNSIGKVMRWQTPCWHP
jgi:hypothetical protein